MIKILFKNLKLIFLFLVITLLLLYIIVYFAFIDIRIASDKYQTTVISAYFKINKSKHSDSDYQKWIQNFLSSVKSPLVLFTDNSSISKQLLDLRKHLPTRLYIYSSHWDILKEIEQKRNKNYTLNYKHVQNKLDKESAIHSPDLYVLWNMKSYLTNKIAQENPFDSKFFIYTDSGAWRHEKLLDWPNESFIIKNLSNLIKENILLAQISDEDKSIHMPLVDCIEGTFFMGSKIATANFERYFWEIHDQRFDQGLFIGKDQTIMNLFTFKSNKSHLIKILKARRTNCIKQIDVWFFYQYYLASDKYFACKRKEEYIVD